MRLGHSGFKPQTPIQQGYFPQKEAIAICSTSRYHDLVKAVDQDGKSVSASTISVTVIMCRFQSPATRLVRRNGQTYLVTRLVRSWPFGWLSWRKVTQLRTLTDGHPKRQGLGRQHSDDHR
jgi:hypothetical protein